MTLSALIDFFVHPDYFDHPNQLRRARLLVRANLLTSMFSTSYVFLSYVFGYEKGVYLMLMNVGGFIVYAFLVKTKLGLNLLGNAYVVTGAFAIIVLTYFSGGVWSAIYPWIISIPVLALLVVGRKSGMVWGVISFLFMLWFAMLAYQGKELPVEYNLELKTIWYISVLPGLLLIILFIAFVFEYTQTKALSDLEASNRMLSNQKETIAIQSEKLGELIDEKDHIIRILAHDLRSPLQNIESLTNLMHESEDDRDEHNKFRGMIHQSVINAQKLVEKVLEMDASDQLDIRIQIEAINLSDLILFVIESKKHHAAEKHIKVALVNDIPSLEVRTDRTYLTLVFENLLSNAIKFSPNGKSIKFEVTRNESGTLIYVKDEGPGIQPKEEHKLFKKFSKLSSRPTAGESSTGLGLSLVKRYVDLMGGKVWYENSQNQGAVFVVWLPHDPI